ncbi:MAG: FAD-dependent oxidoreductase [Patescibacteria group bacterium]
MKTAIVGAGICGLYLAWKLSEKGENVTVFEKKEKIGKEVCSGLFSKKILDFIPESESLVQNEIDFVLIHFPKKIFKIDFTDKFFVINHARLDGIIYNLARNAGAEILLDHCVGPFPEGFERIIGCDGAMSQVRKNLGMRDPKFRLAIRGFLPKKDFSNFVETWATKAGFIWRIPRGENTEYGIIEEPKICGAIFEEFLQKNNISLNDKKSALVPCGFLVPENKEITLCGDAAGLTKPWSGGGVIWGLTAADALLKNFPNFLKYQRECKKIFRFNFVFSRVATKIVYFMGFNIRWILPSRFRIEGDFLKK